MKDDDEMADLERILHPKKRFQAQKLLDRVVGQSSRRQKTKTGKEERRVATRQMKRLSSLSSSNQEQAADGGPSDDEEYQDQEPGKGWFLGCDPGPGFSKCLRESVRQTSRQMTPRMKPFYNRRQRNAGCAPGPGFSSCMVDNLDLDQPNYQADGYWPITGDANANFLKEDEGLNVDQWWDTNADPGASLFTFTPRRQSQSAEPGYAMRASGGKMQSLHFVPGVGLVKARRAAAASASSSSLRWAGAAANSESESTPPVTAAVGTGVKSGDEKRALAVADGALASASRQLGREAAQRKQLRKQQHKRAQKLALLRKLQGKKVVEALDANKAVNKKQKEALLVEELHRQLNDKNFKASGYLPLDGNARRLRRRGVNVNGQQLHVDMNFKRKGYWPVTGNSGKLERLGVKVCAMSPPDARCAVLLSLCASGSARGCPRPRLAALACGSRLALHWLRFASLLPSRW